MNLSIKDISPQPLSAQGTHSNLATFEPPRELEAAGKTVICRLPSRTRIQSHANPGPSLTFTISDQNGYRECTEKGGEVTIVTKESEQKGMDIKDASFPRKFPGKQ